MRHSDYIAKRDQLVAGFLADTSVIDKSSLQFNVVSASLSNYLPGINEKLHYKIYRDILLHQRLSMLEQDNFSVLDFVRYENLDEQLLNLLKNNPIVICTFHTGSYRLINLFLMQQKIPFSLVIAGKVMEQQGDKYRHLFQELSLNMGDELKFIEAESSTSGLSMLKELKRGKSLVVYIDGNTGSGSISAQNNNHCLVNFLEQGLFARKGAAFLSHISNCAMITVASYRKSIDDIRLRFSDIMYPDTNLDRNRFAEITTQKMYNEFAGIVARYPEQWEGWLYIHKSAHMRSRLCKKKFTNTLKSATSKFVSFNCKEFGIFKIEKASFLFQKRNYSSYPIDAALYNFLSACMLKHTDANSISTCLLDQLCEMRIVLPAYPVGVYKI